MVLKRIGVWSAARVAGALYAAMGLAVGAIFAAASVLGAGFANAADTENVLPAFMGVAFGCGAVIFMPLFYGALGAIMTAFSAWLYNVLAGMVGGIEVDLE
jgi:hypothetical protein